MTDGLRLVWRVPILRAVLVQTPLVNFAFSGVLFNNILTMRQDGVSATVIGLMQAAIAAGGLLGAVARKPTTLASVGARPVPRAHRGSCENRCPAGGAR